MKRIISVFLSLCLLFSGLCLVSCDRDTQQDDRLDDSRNSDSSDDTSDSMVDDEQDRKQAEQALRDTFLAKADAVIVEEDSVTFTDASGNADTAITIKKNPAAVINLYASFTTLWYEAGGEVIGCIGGSTSQELYTESIGRDITTDDSVTVVATSSAGKKWDVESILALQPDLILCSTAMSGYTTVKGPAEAAGIPLVAVDYNDFSDYLKWFKVFCHLNGRSDLWDSVAVPALDEVITVLLSCPTENTPSVFSMFASADSLQANTSNTVVGGMISAMNAVNIVDSWDNAPEAERLDINLETVFSADPDVILVQCHADVETARELVQTMYGDNPVWQSLRAVQNDRVYYLEKKLFHNKPNRRFADAYRIMASYLYPEITEN